MHFQLVFGPRLKGEAWNAAVAEARPMFETYRKTLESRIAPGRKLLGEALADAVFSEDDFLRRRKHVEEEPA